jgi:hypothetical protein
MMKKIGVYTLNGKKIAFAQFHCDPNFPRFIELHNIFYFTSQTRMNMSIAAEILPQQEDHA